MHDFQGALSSSLDLRTVLDEAFPLLARLIPADCGALCVSNPASVGGYDWSMLDFPVDWFSAYAEMAPHDFVRSSVLEKPNQVLRDSEMLRSRKKLEANMMYQRAREIGAPLEQVMSVMLDFKTTWHAGITLYRGRRRPFSNEQRALLQRVTPWIGNAVKNCKLFAGEALRGSVLDGILQSMGLEMVVMSSSNTPVTRTEGYAPLVTRWFQLAELNKYGVPTVLNDALHKYSREHDRGAIHPFTWTRTAPDGALLSVMFVRVRGESGRTVWTLVFQEISQIPMAWMRRLTRAEVKVTQRVLLGWDNQLIADDLGCKLATVKKHLTSIFDKLGISSRTALCHRAAQRS